METLRKKWNSRQGASILIALLFLLVCMMVGASVLMAAASNAGKIRSNREEHQRYLTLSSALTLMCGELESVEYVGKYSYTKTPVYVTEIDENGNAALVLDHYKHSYKQEEGELRKGSSRWELNMSFPLYNDLDICFANQFEVPISQQSPIDEYIYTPLNTANILLRSPHTVTVKTKDTVDANVYGGLTEAVTIKAELNAKGEITLTATLTADDSYRMEAVLKPSGKLEQLLVLDSQSADGTYETKAETEPKSLAWTLDHIVKKEKEVGG